MPAPLDRRAMAPHRHPPATGTTRRLPHVPIEGDPLLHQPHSRIAYTCLHHLTNKTGSQPLNQGYQLRKMGTPAPQCRNHRNHFSPGILPHLRSEVHGPAPPAKEMIARERVSLLPLVLLAADAASHTLAVSECGSRSIVRSDPHLCHHLLWRRVVLPDSKKDSTTRTE